MSHKSRSDSEPVYRIQVEGLLDHKWVAWFNGMSIAFDGSTTTLIGPVADQAALRGILCKLWDLNLNLISTRRIETDNKEEHENG